MSLLENINIKTRKGFMGATLHENIRRTSITQRGKQNPFDNNLYLKRTSILQQNTNEKMITEPSELFTHRKRKVTSPAKPHMMYNLTVYRKNARKT